MIGGTDGESSSKQRRAPRQRALLGGKLAYGEGYFSIDCLVRDISPLGARVKLPEGQAVPPTAYFLEVRSGAIHEARVVWRRHPEIGLEFLRKCTVDDTSNGDLKLLKRLWIESKERSGLEA